MIESSDNNPTNTDSSGSKNTSSLNNKEISAETTENGDKQMSEDESNSGQKWVNFDNSKKNVEQNGDKADENLDEIKLESKRQSQEPAVLDTEVIHVTIEQPLSPTLKLMTPIDVVDNSSQPSRPPRSSIGGVGQNKTSGPAVIDIPVTINGLNELNSHEMRTVDLSNTKFRDGFANGDVIVDLLPIETGFRWIRPAKFKPELVPEELMAHGLSLTVEDYVLAMEMLVNDYRFTMYNICYKRVLVIWFIFSFLILMCIIFSGYTGIKLFSAGVVWLFLNSGAIFVCMFTKVNLCHDLERCIARINKHLLRHKILITLNDHGNFSCQKVNLVFLYFDTSHCIEYLNDFIERSELNGGDSTGVDGWKNLDVSLDDIIIQGSNSMRVPRKQSRAEETFLRYIQRWGKDFLRRRLDWTLEDGEVNIAPRHLSTAYCPCQYIEEIIIQKTKRLASSRSIFARINNWCAGYGFQFC